MNELYELIEKKIKESGYHVRFPEQMYMMISVTRLKEKRTDPMFYFPNLRMILSLNIILLLWMKSLISVY